MHESFISVLFSPITLLFLINAFFLIFVTAFVWSIFLGIQYTSSLFKMDSTNPLLLKAALFFPLILIALVAEYQWSLLTHLNFFPLLSSSFVRFNLIGIIVSIIALLFIKSLDKEKEGEEFKIALFFVTYLIVLYLFFLIIFMATVVTRLNAFPDSFLSHYSYPTAERINQYVLGALFLFYMTGVFFVVSMRAIPRVLLCLAYTIALTFMYSIVFR